MQQRPELFESVDMHLAEAIAVVIPGELTRRYVEGQRASFISPIALFLFCVFLMFAAVSMLGDIGHLLSEEKLADIGSVDIACVPLGGSLSPQRAAAIIAQLDPKIVVPMPICDDDADCADALKKFFHEMGAEATTQPKLAVTATSLPAETITVLLESRGKVV